MNVTITLNVSGSEAGPFSIYQDSDNFALAIATNVSVSELTAGFQVAADGSSRTLKVQSESSCQAVDFVDLKFNDTTPSAITTNHNVFPASGAARSIFADSSDKGGIIINYRGNTFFSTTNGNSWFTTYPGNYVYNGFYLPVYNDITDKFWLISRNSDFYEILDLNDSSRESGSIPGISNSKGDAIFHNGVLYIRANDGVYRLNPNTDAGFLKVISFAATSTGSDFEKQNSIAGYGNTILIADARSGNGLYKSTDNGLNFTKIRSSAVQVTIDENGNSYYFYNDNIAGRTSIYSEDFFEMSGSNISSSFTLKYDKVGGDIHRYGRLWFFTKETGNGSQALAFREDITQAGADTIVAGTNALTANLTNLPETSFNNCRIFSSKNCIFIVGADGNYSEGPSVRTQKVQIDYT